MLWDKCTPGIPEELFHRGEVPLTKTEVRVVALAKLQLRPDHHLLDIGCGTGSVTVEAALQCSRGRVTALDRNGEAVRLTRLNADRFGLDNVTVIQGSAPADLPDQSFHRIFIGGGSSDLPGVVDYAHSHLLPEGRLVADTILLDSAYRLLQALESKGFQDLDCICLNIARGEKLAPGWMMKALNPIYIISGRR